MSACTDSRVSNCVEQLGGGVDRTLSRINLCVSFSESDGNGAAHISQRAELADL